MRIQVLVLVLALVLGISLSACSSDDTTDAASDGIGGKGTGSSGTANASLGGRSNLAGSGNQSGTGGTSSQNVAGSANVNAGCAAWPKQKVFPTVGPFFYGPNPGPCKMTVLPTSATVAEQIFTFNYDTTKQLASQTSGDGAAVVTYQFEQGLLVSETSTTNGDATVTTYTYSGNTVTYSSTTSGGVISGYRYTLDAQGYPIATTALNPPATVTESTPTYYAYEYENCRIVRRVGYNAVNAVVANYLTQYTYDSLGRVSHRTSATRDELYDYSCW